MPIGNIKCLREFSRPGAKLTEIINATAFLHHVDATPRLNRTEQNETIRLPFHQHVQHPVVAVTKVNVGGSAFVPLDKTSHTWPRKSVRGFIVDFCIILHLDEHPSAIAPYQS